MTASDHNNQYHEHADGIVEDCKKAPPIYFRLLHYGLIIWGIGFCAYYLFSGWSSEGEFEEKMAVYTQTYTPEATATSSAGADQAGAATSAAGGINAAALYTTNCAGCHGSGGSGGFATDLTGDYAYGKETESIRSSIADGRGDMMPGFADNLSAEQIDALVSYLLEL